MMKQTWPAERTKKFKQAAFVYLYVAILYESTVYVMFDANILPVRLGPPIIWLIGGGLIALSVFLGLYFLNNVWISRSIWTLQAFRFPGLIAGAFFPQPDTLTPTNFYIAALVAVSINFWTLARASWDL
jgi:hypothetical protein